MFPVDQTDFPPLHVLAVEDQHCPDCYRRPGLPCSGHAGTHKARLDLAKAQRYLLEKGHTPSLTTWKPDHGRELRENTPPILFDYPGLQEDAQTALIL